MEIIIEYVIRYLIAKKLRIKGLTRREKFGTYRYNYRFHTARI